jgi:ABC-type dipeptide/oligopeptide/nickel transport system permease component
MAARRAAWRSGILARLEQRSRPLLGVRARNTLLLSGSATLLAWILALPIGIWSAAKRGRPLDRAAGVAMSALLTVPDLLLFLALLLLAVRTSWFPTGGMGAPRKISRCTSHCPPVDWRWPCYRCWCATCEPR